MEEDEDQLLDQARTGEGPDEPTKDQGYEEQVDALRPTLPPTPSFERPDYTEPAWKTDMRAGINWSQYGPRGEATERTPDTGVNPGVMPTRSAQHPEMPDPSWDPNAERLKTQEAPVSFPQFLAGATNAHDLEDPEVQRRLGGIQPVTDFVSGMGEKILQGGVDAAKKVGKVLTFFLSPSQFIEAAQKHWSMDALLEEGAKRAMEKAKTLADTGSAEWAGLPGSASSQPGGQMGAPQAPQAPQPGVVPAPPGAPQGQGLKPALNATAPPGQGPQQPETSAMSNDPRLTPGSPSMGHGGQDPTGRMAPQLIQQAEQRQAQFPGRPGNVPMGGTPQRPAAWGPAGPASVQGGVIPPTPQGGAPRPQRGIFDSIENEPVVPWNRPEKNQEKGFNENRRTGNDYASRDLRNQQAVSQHMREDGVVPQPIGQGGGGNSGLSREAQAQMDYIQTNMPLGRARDAAIMAVLQNEQRYNSDFKKSAIGPTINGQFSLERARLQAEAAAARTKELQGGLDRRSLDRIMNSRQIAEFVVGNKMDAGQQQSFLKGIEAIMRADPTLVENPEEVLKKYKELFGAPRMPASPTPGATAPAAAPRPQQAAPPAAAGTTTAPGSVPRYNAMNGKWYIKGPDGRTGVEVPAPR